MLFLWDLMTGVLLKTMTLFSGARFVHLSVIILSIFRLLLQFFLQKKYSNASLNFSLCKFRAILMKNQDKIQKLDTLRQLILKLFMLRYKCKICSKFEL